MEQLRITLAAARVNAGLTQENVARDIGISKNTLVNWEKGRTEPSIAQSRKLAQLYQIPLDNIFLPTSSN